MQSTLKFVFCKYADLPSRITNRESLLWMLRIFYFIHHGHGVILNWNLTHALAISNRLIAKKLCVCRTVVCAAPSYLRKVAAPKTVEDLTQHPCLLFPGFQRQNWQFHDKHNRIKNIEVEGRLQINNIDALMHACIAGLGLAHFPTFLASPMIREGKLAMITIANYAFLSPNIYIVYPSRQYLPSKVRAFITALTKWVTPEPVWDRGLDQRSEK